MILDYLRREVSMTMLELIGIVIISELVYSMLDEIDWGKKVDRLLKRK